MSVQVRRRRDTAAFLQGFVGAGGELLVDTTNNRVQVHDGATPGGWPAAAIGDLPGRNALINGSFAINQRSYASGTALAAGTYAHDRWKAGSGGCTYTFTQGTPDTAIAVTAGTLIQTVEAAIVSAGSWWLTWTGTAQARVWSGSASGAFSAGTAAKVAGAAVNALLVSGLATGTAVNVEFGTGTIGTVQLEAALPGAGPTRFERRHAEILLCTRFYRVLRGTGNDIASVNAQSNSVNVLLGDVSGMRAAPTLAHSLTDATYTGASPTGTQWAMSQPGYSFASKSGTLGFVATPGPVFAYLTIVGTFSPLPTSLALGPSAFISLSAEI